MSRYELNAIMEHLLNYTEEVNEGIREIAEELAKDGVKELKKTSPKKSGKYAKGWRVKRKQGPSFINLKIHNFKYGSLTHLLEFGHSTRNGGRTKKYPHIKPVEERINNEFEERVKKLIGGAK